MNTTVKVIAGVALAAYLYVCYRYYLRPCLKEITEESLRRGERDWRPYNPTNSK